MILLEIEKADARMIMLAIELAGRHLHTNGEMLPPRLARLYDTLKDWTGPGRTETDVEEGASYGPSMLLTTQEVAARIKVSDRTIRRLVTSGKLRSVTVGRARRIRPDDLKEWMETL